MERLVQKESLDLRLERVLQVAESTEWESEIPPVSAGLRLAILALDPEKLRSGVIDHEKLWAITALNEASDDQLAFVIRAALR